jgi:hypothetical protein
VPGLAIALWFAFAALRYGWYVVVFVSQRSTPVARLAYGLGAFLVANLAVFTVATQLFGDLFVLLILGLVAGFFLATPVLAEREYSKKRSPPEPTRSTQPTAVRGARWARAAGQP